MEPPLRKAKVKHRDGEVRNDRRGIWQRREHKDDPETWEAHESLEVG
jgi:hypothetical protein